MTSPFPGRSGPLIIAAVTVLAVTPPLPAHAQPAVTPPAAAAKTLTLITGDKVTVRNGATSVQGADGRPVGAHIISVGQDTYVYPDSVAPYLGGGLLDKRLFNVSLLLRQGYDDAATGRLPVILGYDSTAASRRTDALPAGGAEVRALPSIRGRAVTRERTRAGEFWSSLKGVGKTPSFAYGITKVWLDGKVQADLADTVAQIGAPQVWATGNVGDDVDVAVLDTGIDAQHPDLAGQIESSVSFVPGEEVTDRHGHGTHVASTIAGTGAASDGLEKGVAPGVDLQIGKVLNDGGGGMDSWIIAGMEWAARDRKAKVISMSLGGDPTDGTDPMSQAVNQLSAETGALFVIAAGNSGPGETSVGTPGAADAALTVGAVDSADHIADFSSRGPRLVDRALKPEITAPGVGVLAARSQYSSGEGFYKTMSGTSMATPHVAGAAALLAAQHPGWSGPQLKDALVSTAKETPELGPYDGGSGRVDISKTTQASVFATGSAYLGIHPREDEPTGEIERPVTYTNTAATDVTISLDVTAPGAPEGLISLSASQVTVPAGGTSTVTVSADLSRTAEKGLYTGRIAATAPDGALLADTVIGVSTEDQPRHLVVEAEGRNGEPMAGQITMLREGDPEGYYYSYLTGSGTLDILVPDGVYSVWMWGEVQGTHGPNSLGVALVTAPRVVVEANTTVRLDAGATREIKAQTPRPSADAELRLDYHRKLGGSAEVTDSYVASRFYDSIWVTPGDHADDGEMSVTARWRKTQPVLSVVHDGREFDDLLVLPGAALLPEGRSQIPAVYAGRGTEADFAAVDVTGRIAVVRRGLIDKQVAFAEKAGAKLLLIVNDEAGRYFDGTHRTTVAVATLTKDGGDRLIRQLRQGPVSLRVVSHPSTEYLYDLVRHWDGRVPEVVTYRPGESELGRVDVDFRKAAGREVYEYRYDLNPDQPAKLGFGPPPARTERFRTDWVTVQDGVRWASEVSDGLSIQWGGSKAYLPGVTTREQWLGAIQRPRLNDAVSLPSRTGNRITVEVPGWGDSGADHAGLAVPGQVDQNLALYQGNTLVEQTPGAYLTGEAELSPQRLPYRFIATTERDPAVYPYSVKTRTAWHFFSKAGTSVLPFVQLDYTVDTDLDHRAARDAELTVIPSELPGVPGRETIQSATIDISYDDGATWTSQPVKKAGDGWKTQLNAPATAEHVTLRAGAADSGGNKVEQTVVRAFGLK